MGYALYVAVKLIAYVGWCWFGLRLWRPPSATLLKAVGLGVVRLVIGIGFGVLIFLAFSTGPDNLLAKYIAIYAPVRLVEWFILALIIGSEEKKRTGSGVILWCLGGILVSFLADFASPEGIQGHFCVGRCLC